MTDTRYPPNTNAPPRPWPSDPRFLTDNTRCPACFHGLDGPVCRICDLDLRSARAVELLELGRVVVEDERMRQLLIDQMRTEQAAAAAAFASQPPARQPYTPQAPTWQPPAWQSHAPQTVAPPAVPTPPPPMRPVAQATPVPKRSGRSGMQIFLLTIGIVLVSVAALFFVFVAYLIAPLSVRTMMTIVATLVVLGVAWLLRRLGLKSTGEGLAALAVVLSLLDVWLIWAADLFGARSVRLDVYTGGALIVLAAILGGVAVPSRLRALRFSAVSLAPFGVFFLVLGLLSKASTATAWWVALSVTSLTALLAPLLSRRAEVSLCRIIAYVAGTLALPLSVGALGDGPWRAAAAFAILAAVWGVQALVGLRALSASRARVAVGYSAATAGIATAAGAFSLEFVDGDARTYLPVALGCTLAGTIAALVIARRSRPGSRVRVAGWSAFAPLLAAAAILTLMVLVALLSPIVVTVRSIVRQPWHADLPPAADAHPLVWLPVVAALVGAIVCLTGARVARSAGAPSAVGVGFLATAALGASACMPSAVFMWIAVSACGAIALAVLVVLGNRSRAGAIRLVPIRAVLSAVLAVAAVGATVVAFADGALWPVSVLVGLLLSVSARVVSRRMMPELPGVGAAVATGAVCMLASIMIAALPFWLWSGWRGAGSLIARPMDLGLWLGAAAAAALILLALLNSRRMPRFDLHVTAAVAAFDLVVALPLLLTASSSVVARGTARPAVLGLLALAAILWQLAPPKAPRSERTVAAVAGPLAVIGCAAALSDLPQIAAAAVLPLGVIVSAALALTIFRARRGLQHRLWHATTVIAGAFVTVWAFIVPANSQWVALLLLAVAAVLCASGFGRVLTGPDWRRHLAWAGIPLGVAALWSALLRGSVHVVEPYTLPVAALLVAVAVLIAWRRPVERFGSSGRRILVWAAAALTVLPSVVAVAIQPSDAGSPDNGMLRPIVLVAGGVAITVVGFLVPAGIDGVPLRLVLVASGLTSAIISGAIEAVATSTLRGGGLDLEAWVLPGILATLVATAVWVRRPSPPLWLTAILGVVALVTLVVVEIPSISTGQLAVARALFALCLLGAAYVIGALFWNASHASVVRWSALAGMIVLSGLALVAGTVQPFELATVPIALALGVVGLTHLEQNAGTRTWQQLGAATAVLLIPSLVVDSTGTTLWRVLALAVASLAILVASAVKRWQAPLLISGVVLVAHGIAQLWPWISSLYPLLPFWVWLGVGGIILIVLAATYEQRVRNARSIARSIRSLR